MYSCTLWTLLAPYFCDVAYLRWMFHQKRAKNETLTKYWGTILVGKICLPRFFFRVFAVPFLRVLQYAVISSSSLTSFTSFFKFCFQGFRIMIVLWMLVQVLALHPGQHLLHHRQFLPRLEAMSWSQPVAFGIGVVELLFKILLTIDLTFPRVPLTVN